MLHSPKNLSWSKLTYLMRLRLGFSDVIVVISWVSWNQEDAIGQKPTVQKRKVNGRRLRRLSTWGWQFEHPHRGILFISWFAVILTDLTEIPRSQSQMWITVLGHIFIIHSKDHDGNKCNMYLYIYIIHMYDWYDIHTPSYVHHMHLCIYNHLLHTCISYIYIPFGYLT